MDFSKSAFGLPTSSSTLSNDTMGHAVKVEACRWGWTFDPHAAGSSAPREPAPAVQARATTSQTVRPSRSTPCRGRLYHQLACSHRIRTDLVEDCGSNCLEPYGTVSSVPFFCQECVESEAKNIWQARETQHNSSHPPLNEMTPEQYDVWYEEHRKLEAIFTRDHKMYEMELKSKTRPSNICSALQIDEEEKAFAAEIDSLSLAMMSSSDSSAGADLHPPARTRISLPNDASEQIHWGLNSLAIDRGPCGTEYSSQPPNGVSPMQAMNEEELWGRPRERK